MFTSHTSEKNHIPETFEVFVMNPDGSNRTQLTNMGQAYVPQWSVNGSRILFRKYGEPAQLFSMTPDGSELVQLLDTIDGGYDLSPNGTSLAFTKLDSTGFFHIYKLGVNDRTLEKLTDSERDGNPVWSLDGEIIVFESWRNQTGFGELYVMNANGSDLKRITNITDHILYYDLSPDSKKIAFSSGRARHHNWDIYVMDIDGLNIARLTNMGDNSFRGWSPIRM